MRAERGSPTGAAVTDTVDRRCVLISVIAGVILIGVAVVDTVGTLVATRIQTRRWWPTAVLYRYTWPWWRAVGRKVEDEDRREGFLSIYGPLSLLTLLVFWVTTQVVGWGLVWWGLRDGIQTLDSLLESIYYAGHRVLHRRLR